MGGRVESEYPFYPQVRNIPVFHHSIWADVEYGNVMG